MSILPIQNVINVTITTTPSGLTEKNVNSLGLLTHERPSNSDAYREYISASQVAADYGTASLTAQMANAIFSQTPNLRSGGGRLMIVPMNNAVSATSGKVVTADLTATLASIVGVSAGDLKVTVNGTAINLSGLNFTGCITLVDVAKVIQNALPRCVVTATATQITITSKKVGTASTVALGAVTGGTGTDLSATGYLKSANATATAGVNSSGETILAAIARTEGSAGFVPVITTLDLEDAAIVTIAAGIQAQDRIFLHHFADTADITGIVKTIADSKNTKTRSIVYTTDLPSARLAKASYSGRGFSVQFTGSKTSGTMNLKSLATVTPDLGISQTDLTNALNNGADLYVSYDGVPCVVSSGGNEYFDNIYSDIALKFHLQTAGFNYLRQTNTKVPQEESGMEGLKDAYSQVMERFVRNGCIAPGTWQSSETFGDPETFKQNVTSKGYYVFSIPLAVQSSTERANRKAPLVQIAAKRAGAIHSGDVQVNINP